MALAQCGLTMSDDDLVSRVREGDDVAFEQLYGRYGGRIGGYVAGMVGDAGRSEDVTQEVFVSALRRLRATDRPVAFKPWVYEIARNAAIDEHRRRSRVREVPTQHEDEGGRPGLEALPGGSVDPARAVETREALSDLTSALAGLTETHRRVLVLRELEGRTYGEIAAATGLTVPAVESALFRARRRLGAEYEELSSGRRCEAVCGTVEAGHPVSGRALEALRRHLSHCQPCRRHAFAAGFDLAGLGLGGDRMPAGADARAVAGRRAGLPRRAGSRVGALLPVPAVLWLRRASDVVAGAGDQPAAWSKAVAATAVVLAAGGAGVVAHRDAADNAQRPAIARVAAERSDGTRRAPVVLAGDTASRVAAPPTAPRASRTGARPAGRATAPGARTPGRSVPAARPAPATARPAVPAPAPAAPAVPPTAGPDATATPAPSSGLPAAPDAPATAAPVTGGSAAGGSATGLIGSLRTPPPAPDAATAPAAGIAQAVPQAVARAGEAVQALEAAALGGATGG